MLNSDGEQTCRGLDDLLRPGHVNVDAVRDVPTIADIEAALNNAGEALIDHLRTIAPTYATGAFRDNRVTPWIDVTNYLASGHTIVIRWKFDPYLDHEEFEAWLDRMLKLDETELPSDQVYATGVLTNVVAITYDIDNMIWLEPEAVDEE